MRKVWSVGAPVVVCLAVFAQSAPAQTPLGPQPLALRGPLQPDAVPIRDPWEKLNRRLYAFNKALDRAVVRPGVVFYHRATPRPLRNALHNALTNLTGPIVFINDVLQLKPKKAAVTAGRFVINTTIGFVGFNDPAQTVFTLPYHNADFGQTLGHYGVGPGPYLFIPILGPSTVRDILGRGVDGVVDPFNSISYDGRASLSLSRILGGGLDARDRAEPVLRDIDRTATDSYAFTRSAYLQNRAAAVRGEDVTDASVKALPDFGPEPAAAPAGSTPTMPPATTDQAASEAPPSQR